MTEGGWFKRVSGQKLKGVTTLFNKVECKVKRTANGYLEVWQIRSRSDRPAILSLLALCVWPARTFRQEAVLISSTWHTECEMRGRVDEIAPVRRPLRIDSRRIGRFY